jgi:hypothetical protein
MTRVQEGQNNERKISNMKTRNTVFTAILFALALALAQVVEATPRPDGGPTPVDPPANEGASSAYSTSPEDVQLPVVTIHSTGDVTRGKTGSFVLDMNPPIMLGGAYVNFSVSGTAIPGVDYVSLVSPTYIGQSGYGAILVQTLPDPRASSFRQGYSVVVTLKPGLGYAVGEPSSAKIMIKP